MTAIDTNSDPYKMLAQYVSDIVKTKKRFDLTSLGMLAKQKDISTAELIDSIENLPREILEQSYCEILDKIYMDVSQEGRKIIDDLTSPLEGELCFDNYFPQDDKKIKAGGSWIKMPYENGFFIALAKQAPKYKKNFRDLKVMAMKKLDEFSSQDIKKLNIQELEAYGEKRYKLHEDYIKYMLMELLGGPPTYAVFNKTKSKKIYVLPNQYETENDIEFYVDLSIKNPKSIKLKPIWTAENRDSIFYLQSRGISKNKAIALSMLNQCHIVVDIKNLY